MKTRIQHLWHTLSSYKSYGFCRFVFRRFSEVGVPQVAGSLTFTTLLSLVPLLTVMLVMVTAFPVFGDVSDSLNHFIQRTIVPSGASAIGEYLDEFKVQAGSLTAVGILIMMLTALMLIHTIDETFNRIWRVRRQRSLLVRLPVYWALLTIGPIAIGISLSASTQLMQAEHFGHFSGSLKTLSQILLNSLFLTLLYRIVPNCHVPLRHALAGALLTAVLLEGAKWGFGLYLRNFNSYRLIYGAFALIPIFLVWLHLLWMIIIGGALLTSCIGYWQNQAFLHADKPQIFGDALALLLLLAQAQEQGKTLSVQDINRRLGIGFDRAENLLSLFARHRYAEYGQKGWLLRTAAEHIRLKELFNQFACHPENQPLIATHIHIDDLTLAQLLEHKRNTFQAA